jgi:Domain of unknown function (DUF6438)
VTFARVPPEYSDNVPPDLIDQAESLAGTLRFTAFRHNGRAVPVVFDWYVRILPPETSRPPVPAIKVRDWSTVAIQLERAGCFGSCPAYDIQIRGDGSVTYSGKGFVGTTGLHSGSMSRANLVELIWVIEQANYFSLRTTYGMCGLDGPDAFLAVTIDGRRKGVQDCTLEWTPALESLRKIENAIDRLSGAERWIFPLYKDNPELDP